MIGGASPIFWETLLLNTSLTLLLPYAMLWLYFSWRDNKIKLAELKEQPDVSGTETDDSAPG